MALCFRGGGHVIAAVVVIFIDLAFGIEHLSMSLVLHRWHAIAVIVVTYHVALVAMGGITISAIVTVFACGFLPIAAAARALLSIAPWHSFALRFLLPTWIRPMTRYWRLRVSTRKRRT